MLVVHIKYLGNCMWQLFISISKVVVGILDGLNVWPKKISHIIIARPRNG